MNLQKVKFLETNYPKIYGNCLQWTKIEKLSRQQFFYQPLNRRSKKVKYINVVDVKVDELVIFVRRLEEVTNLRRFSSLVKVVHLSGKINKMILSQQAILFSFITLLLSASIGTHLVQLYSSLLVKILVSCFVLIFYFAINRVVLPEIV